MEKRSLVGKGSHGSMGVENFERLIDHNVFESQASGDE